MKILGAVALIYFTITFGERIIYHWKQKELKPYLIYILMYFSLAPVTTMNLYF